ncbi:glycosyltransferase family 2 protein [Corynebacterium sanguinis]|uniref:4,4'-diaponeurosporenoate glycosyltransferase n=1 Tax=Corynebacterium sanguinis TaxID=2594913 RepID=A0A6C1U054_9CORY|nr:MULTISPECIES: glycosyltransferase family 2 protein [Corynebacterium]MDN8576754.1 glycosyltransferase family 2 protein [Corynebacterium sanguinis]MDN8622512.1 glycosyltransferase family 2 protein [Corynebacterium sanguinis]QDR76619.1 glycosyltransferase [Corynebacterium sanguinis]TVS22203.1 glycosyltransferase [Corynebacterium sanguinis]TVS22714.1 glycosyltransferase [Corynebacterium sanguinis]
MPAPRIGLVIPCLNDADLLAPCLDSVSRQREPFDCVIVVDNGSTDNTADVARSYGAVVVSEPRRGVTWASHAGYSEAAARGLDVIVRIDADVRVSPTFSLQWKNAWEEAASNPNKDVVGMTGAARFDLPGWRGRLLSALYLRAYRYSVGSALGHTPFFGTNCTLSAAWWLDVRDAIDPSDTFSHDDIQMSFAVRAHETVLFRPEITLLTDPRPLRGARQLARRFSRGMHSMRQGFKNSPPQRRLCERV